MGVSATPVACVSDACVAECLETGVSTAAATPADNPNRRSHPVLRAVAMDSHFCPVSSGTLPPGHSLQVFDASRYCVAVQLASVFGALATQLGPLAAWTSQSSFAEHDGRQT
jgi:hypothetical protein